MYLQIVFLTEHEQHHVGVLLDRAGLAQVRKLRPLVVAALDLPRQLRERQDRDVEFLGQRLEPGGDFGDFLHAVFARAAARALQELDIVDDQEIEAALPLEPPRARRELRNRKTAGLVDIERQRLQLDRDVLDVSKSASSITPRRILLDGIPVCSAMMRVASCSADISSEKKPTIPPLTVSVWPSGGLRRARLGDVVGDVGRQRGLAHARAAGEDDQVGILQAAHLRSRSVRPVASPERPPSRW